MSKTRTGLEHSRNTADPRSRSGGNGAPSLAEMDRIATQAELGAVRREYKQLLKFCNSIQLTFIALARTLNVSPAQLAEFIAQESANKNYEADAVRELTRVKTTMAESITKIAKS